MIDIRNAKLIAFDIVTVMNSNRYANNGKAYRIKYIYPKSLGHTIYIETNLHE